MPIATGSSRIVSADPAVAKVQAVVAKDLGKLAQQTRKAAGDANKPVFDMAEAIPDATTESKLTLVDQGDGSPALYITTNGRRFKITLSEE
jgi:hypothetical protein